MKPPKSPLVEKHKKALTEVEMATIDYDAIFKPHDQLVLLPDELEEIHGNILYVKEPPKQQTQLIYSNRDKKFITRVDNTEFILMEQKTSLLYLDSANAITQMENEICRIPEDSVENNKNMADEMQEEEQDVDFGMNAVYDDLQNAEEDVGEEYLENENEMDEMDEIGEEENESVVIGAKLDKKSNVVKKEESVLTFVSLPVLKICTVIKLKNKFNYFERSTQTKKINWRNKQTNTTVPKKIPFSAVVTQSNIYDAYIKDFTIKQQEKEKELRGRLAAHKSKKSYKKSEHNVSNREERTLLKVSVMYEKIINLNTTDGIAQDFRYYEDPSDSYRGKGEGTLMQMWKMIFDTAKTLFVTDISWSPDYFDMFAVSLSIPQGHLPCIDNVDVGYVCVWSLTNSSYPEYVTRTHCGANCLSFHQDHGNVLAVGLRDGTLAVYNVSLPTTKPQYKTDSVKTKHKACVGQVVWCKDLPPGRLNFFSVSEDGYVCQWILMKTEMIKVVRLTLIIDMSPEIVLFGLKEVYYARGTTLIFKPDEPERYLVGTAEGFIFKCNTEWSHFEHRFQAHTMPVIRIDYNKFDPNIYLTCSEDCLVKMWEDKSNDPLFIFDLKMALSDLCWSPFSSTVFSVTTTTDCRIIIYDLDVNVYEPVHDQLVHSPDEYRLTRLAFDKRVPMVMIGSSKSTILTFKLSPNLRTSMKPPKKVVTTTEILEFEKLDNILETVRTKPVTIDEIKFCQFQVQTDQSIISPTQTNVIPAMEVSFTNIL